MTLVERYPTLHRGLLQQEATNPELVADLRKSLEESDAFVKEYFARLQSGDTKGAHDLLDKQDS